jgi:hypothetical protein
VKLSSDAQLGDADIDDLIGCCEGCNLVTGLALVRLVAITPARLWARFPYHGYRPACAEALGTAS